jgi:hypothetical protein
LSFFSFFPRLFSLFRSFFLSLFLREWLSLESDEDDGDRALLRFSLCRSFERERERDLDFDRLSLSLSFLLALSLERDLDRERRGLRLRLSRRWW